MLLFYSLFSLGLYNAGATILSSKDLQTDISSQFPTPRDLLKAKMVDKKWIDVGKGFERITPKAGLFMSKQTNEIIFETKAKSWHQLEIVAKWENYPTPRNLIKQKKWNELFQRWCMRHDPNLWQEVAKFLQALAEVVDVNAGQMRSAISGGHCTAISVINHFWDISIIGILLKRPDANPNFKDEFGYTALHEAAFAQNVRGIEILLEHGTKSGDNLTTPLMIAAKSCGGYDSVKTLLSYGENPNLKDRDGKTALHHATGLLFSEISVIDILLKYGAQIDEIDNNLTTSLMIAVGRETYKSLKSVKFLLSHDANPNLRDRDGKTALHHAARKCWGRDIPEILLDYGAKIEKTDIKLRNQLNSMGVQFSIKRKRQIDN